MFPKSNISPNFTKFLIGSLSLILLFTACSPASSPVSPTATFSRFLPPTWTPTITVTPIPTITLASTSMSSDVFQDPGIYPGFWKDGSMYIASSSNGKLQELVHLYDHPTQVSSSGDITYLYNDSETAKISPDGRTLVYMNMEDGFLYGFNLMTKEKNKISQPNSGSSERNWHGNWSLDGKYLLYAIDSMKLRDGQIYGQEFPSIFVTNMTQNIFSQITTWNTVEAVPSWSPDNQWIAFLSDNLKVNSGTVGSFVGATDIFVMSTNCVAKIETCENSFFKPLTNTGVNGDAVAPHWQPNSSNIGFIYINGQSVKYPFYIPMINRHASQSGVLNCVLAG